MRNVNIKFFAKSSDKFYRIITTYPEIIFQLCSWCNFLIINTRLLNYKVFLFNKQFIHGFNINTTRYF
jgi:hypothetical protein